MLDLEAAKIFGVSELRRPGMRLADWVVARESARDGTGIDCETGELVDMMEKGIVDPAPVKIHALLAAAEVAEAIMRINTIIRKKDERSAQPS